MIFDSLQIQAGQVTTPREETAAAGDSPLDVPQRAHSIGEPVPIVFARRRNSNGGILISPGATEARFVNSSINEVTASYHLVLSEGEIDPIPVKDVFQRSCRTGSHSQTYNRRAGTWEPGNYIVDREGYSTPVCPYYCGTTGAFPGISTMSFVSGAIPDGFDFWNRQVHVFVRGGMHVQRYEDGLTGPSDSFADLYRWMLGNISKVPADLIDDDGLAVADTFLRANGFTCNCWITESQNLADWGTKWAPYFLLGTSSTNGERGLRPVLPTTAAGAINVGAIAPAFTFNEDTIIADSFSVEYTNLNQRQPFVCQVIWKQPLDDDIGIVRTNEIRIQGTAIDGPYESHDLSEFCTTENHAVKVGAYILAKRVYTTHNASFAVKPGVHNTLVVPGSIVRISLERETTSAEVGAHDYLYQVERISKTLAGDVGYECTHFPVNGIGQSIVALAVANAEGTGILMSTNRTGVTCDVNSSTDNTLPEDNGIDIDWDSNDNPYGLPIDEPLPVEIPPYDETGGIADQNPTVGLPTCSDQEDCTTTWFADGNQVGDGRCYTPTGDDAGKELTSQTVCDDGTATTNSYGTVNSSPLAESYRWVRWSGTFNTDDPDGPNGTYTSQWFSLSPYRFMTAVGYEFTEQNVSIAGSGIGSPWQSNAYTVFKPSTKRKYFTGSPCAIYRIAYFTGDLAGSYRLPSVSMTSDQGGLIGKISGSWQFSYDKVNVEVSWEGYVNPQVTIATESIVV